MQTLELECPSCSELLELDMGFAGGVCRCSSCGTLMTVPHDAGQGAQAEQLSRPDDPSGMSGVDEAMDPPPTSQRRERASSSRRSSKSKRGKPDRRGGKKKKGNKGGRSTSRAGGMIEQGVYTTASGRKINIDREMDVPTARTRRTGVRIATIAVFFSIIGVVVLVGAFAVLYMIQNPRGGTAGTTEDDEVFVETDPTQFIYSASANPYLIEHPNALGLPLKGTVAIVIDTSNANEDWLETLAQMVGTGLNRPGSEAKVFVIAADASGVRRFRNDPVVPTIVAAGPLVSFVQEGNRSSPGRIEEALDEALDIKPDAIILIIGQPRRSDVFDWGDLLEAYPDIRVHGIIIDGEPSPFDASPFERWITDRSAGRYLELRGDDLLDWRDEWLDRTGD